MPPPHRAECAGGASDLPGTTVPSDPRALLPGLTDVCIYGDFC